jgi:hypothetical protein
MAAEGEGGYVTRGRANALERELAAVEARLTERLDRLEHELQHVATLPLELVRAQSTAMLEVFREVKLSTASTLRGAVATRDERG